MTLSESCKWHEISGSTKSHPCNLKVDWLVEKLSSWAIIHCGVKLFRKIVCKVDKKCSRRHGGKIAWIKCACSHLCGLSLASTTSNAIGYRFKQRVKRLIQEILERCISWALRIGEFPLLIHPMTGYADGLINSMKDIYFYTMINLIQNYFPFRDILLHSWVFYR